MRYLILAAPLVLTSCGTLSALFSLEAGGVVADNVPQLLAGGSRILGGDIIGGLTDMGIAFSMIYTGIWGAKKGKQVLADRVLNPKPAGVTITKG